jgi:hypothetical protein
MGPRNLLILFFSTVAVSLVILIIFFSLFFKNIDFNFNTKLPSSAPELDSSYVKEHGVAPISGSSTMSPDSKAQGLSRSTVNVQPDVREEPIAPSPRSNSRNRALPSDENAPAPPVSDDSVLNDEAPAPLPDAFPPTGGRMAPTPRALPSIPPMGEPVPTRHTRASNAENTSIPPMHGSSEPGSSASGPPVPGQR